MPANTDRTRHRLSEVRTTKGAAAVTALLFQRDEDSGDSGEFVRAMRAYEGRALADPFINVYAAGGASSMAVLTPDFNPLSLVKLPNESSCLRQCIDAMVTNIDSFGYRLEYIGEKDQEDSEASQTERNRIENLMEQPNGEYTVVELRERLRRDIETFGYGFIEVGRDLQNEVTMLAHVPAQTMRMTAKLAERVEITQYLKRNGKLIRITLTRQFRRFVQQVGARMIYFKEFGDPRSIDPATGLVNDTLALDEQATEVYHFSLYSPGSVYGLPRWIGNLPAITGTRESELTNLQFFKDNAIPAMAILVSGGALTGDTVANLENHFTASRGRGSMNRVVVLEATGDESAAKVDGQIPAPKLDMKPLADSRQTDELFAGYEENNEKKVRASFRLPPLFVGRSDDYSHATADASMVMADAQVFGPERNKEDDIWNSNFLTVNGMPLEYWRVRTNPPRLVSADAILTALTTLDELGAMTPNIALGVANELFDLALKPIEAPWGDFPFPLVMQLAIAGNLDGLQDIMIVADMVERTLSNNEKLTEAKILTGHDPSDPAGAAKPAQPGQGRPRPARGKDSDKTPPTTKPTAETKKPKVGGAEGAPGKTSTSKKAAELIAFRFRSLKSQGNAVTDPFFYKAHRRRHRENPPALVVS